MLWHGLDVQEEDLGQVADVVDTHGDGRSQGMISTQARLHRSYLNPYPIITPRLSISGRWVKFDSWMLSGRKMYFLS